MTATTREIAEYRPLLGPGWQAQMDMAIRYAGGRFLRVFVLGEESAVMVRDYLTAKDGIEGQHFEIVFPVKQPTER